MPRLWQNRHNPPTKKEPNNTPSAVTAVSIPLFTTEPGSERSFLQRYDLCLNLQGMDGVTHSEWEGITNLLLQMQAIDDTLNCGPGQ